MHHKLLVVTIFLSFLVKIKNFFLQLSLTISLTRSNYEKNVSWIHLYCMLFEVEVLRIASLCQTLNSLHNIKYWRGIPLSFVSRLKRIDLSGHGSDWICIGWVFRMRIGWGKFDLPYFSNIHPSPLQSKPIKRGRILNRILSDLFGSDPRYPTGLYILLYRSVSVSRYSF